MQSLALWHYRRPFRAPMPLRSRRQALLLPARDGLLLAWRVADRQLWTEVAPLPLFSQESLADAQAALLALMRSADILDVGQLALRYPDHATGLPASVRYGLETGLAWLSTPTTQPKDKFEFSPQLCGLALPGTAQTSAFRVVKQKIDGVDFNQDCQRLNRCGPIESRPATAYRLQSKLVLGASNSGSVAPARGPDRLCGGALRGDEPAPMPSAAPGHRPALGAR